MSLKKAQIVLVDTNSIIEAHRVSCLSALTKFYRIETVEKCIEETQTGFQLRDPEQQIDCVMLRACMHSISEVADIQLAELALRLPSGPYLDSGEENLIAHALIRTDSWLLCGPDKAAIKALHRLGQIDRVVSLESLARDAGVGKKQLSKLSENYTDAWLARIRTALALGLS